MEKGCPPLQGLRHLALRVRDIRKAKDFYQRIFNMKVVWEPDPQNCYLSSGTETSRCTRRPLRAIPIQRNPSGLPWSTSVSLRAARKWWTPGQSGRSRTA